MYVFSEEEGGASDRECSLSRRSAVAAAEGALRGNRIKIVSRDEAYGNFIAYVNFTALKMTSGACAVYLSLSVRLYAQTQYKNYPKPIFGRLELCKEGIIMSGPAIDLQTRINASLKEMMETCISQVEVAGEN